MKLKIKVGVPKFLKSVRYTLAAINGIFLVTGIFLLITGIVVLFIYSDYDDLITRKFFTMPNFVISTGVIIFFTAILGFYGAISEQFIFIAAYVILLLIILVFEVSMVIVAFGMEGNAASDIQSTMLQSLRQYSARIEVAKMWDELQMAYECCGAGGRFDYVSNQIPVSCCHIDYGVIGTFVCTTENAYTRGCAEALGEMLSYNAYVVAVSALVVMCLQIPITAMGGWLAYRSKFEEVELES